MSTWAAALTRVNSADPETHRRGRMLVVIAAAMVLLSAAFIPIVLLTVGTHISVAIIAAATLIYLGALFLGRAGKVNLGASLLIGSTLLALAATIASGAPTPNTPFYMVLVVLFASVLLPPVHIWSVLAFAVLGIVGSFAVLPAELRADPLFRQAAIGAPLLLTVVALISFLSATGTHKALDAAQAARRDAEQATAALAASNTALEARVEERTAALRQSVGEQQAAAEQLQASLEAQQTLNRVIAELSVPVIPISARTLVVPLVGNVDTARAEQLLASILDRVEGSGARTVVLDVTGVAIVDTQVAGALLRVASATRLLGAETVLVGIRPEVAQALVNLGVDLAALRTAATLQDGLAAVGTNGRSSA